MKILLTIESNTYNYNKYNSEYKKINDKYIKIGDEKLWKIYIKK